MSVELTNSGDRDGVEVVQVYAHVVPRVGLPADEPDQWLVGFAKVTVAAGTSCRVDIDIDIDLWRTWDPTVAAWVPR